MPTKFLFVDDETAILNAFDRCLGFDFNIDVADSGENGLRMIEKEGPYAAVFSDMTMPNMNGLEFISKAKEIAPDSKYIMLTGNADKKTAKDAVEEAKVYQFLNKPCQMQTIREIIESFLAAKVSE